MAIAVRASAAARVRVGAASVLAAIVALSALARAVAGGARAVPLYFPDEYLYAELGRSLVEAGRPLVRGEAAGFPALLYPLVTAPAWLLDDVEAGWRLAQVFGAVTMSLAAVPVYLLARRLDLGPHLALALAALAVTVPDLLYAGWLVAETIGYPLALGAVAAGTAALARPSARTQLSFVALAGLATFARVQLAVLVPAFVAALLLVGVRERRLRAALHEQKLTLALLAAPLAAALMLGPDRALGIYRGALTLDLEPLAWADRLGANLYVLAFAGGWILVPGALLGLGLALLRPRSRTELAFGALGFSLAAGLLAQASLFGAVQQVQERYVFYVAPLAAIAFGLYVSRGWPHRLAHALLATALLAASAVVPLSGFSAAEGKAHSAFLFAAFRLEQALGTPGDGAVAIAALAGLFLLAAVAGSLRPRIGTPLALALAVGGTAAASLGAASFDTANTAAVRNAFLPADRAWVDRAGLGPVTLLRTVGGGKTDTLEHLFWNRSVDRVALLPGASQLDHYRARRVAVARDGSLAVAGEPVAGPLLIEGYASTVRLRGAERVASSQTYDLWRPQGRPRLALAFDGRYSDGWLAPAGRLAVWPARGDRVAARLVVTLAAPPAAGDVTVRFRSSAGAWKVELPGGEARTVELPLCSRGAWLGRFVADSAGFAGSRAVSVRAGEPLVRPDPDACRRPVLRVAEAAPREMV